MAADLTAAVKDYITARYVMMRERWAGPCGERALDTLITAEEALFRAATGKGSLVEAAKVFGLKMLGPDAEQTTRRVGKLAPKVSAKIERSLFDAPVDKVKTNVVKRVRF